MRKINVLSLRKNILFFKEKQKLFSKHFYKSTKIDYAF